MAESQAKEDALDLLNQSLKTLDYKIDLFSKLYFIGGKLFR